MCICLYRHTVLKVIFLNSPDIMSFQILCCSDILQIWHNSLTDNTLKKMTQDVLVRCSVIMCDHYMKLAAHFQNLVRQCLMTEYYFQHCLHISTYICIYEYVFQCKCQEWLPQCSLKCILHRCREWLLFVWPKESIVKSWTSKGVKFQGMGWGVLIIVCGHLVQLYYSSS